MFGLIEPIFASRAVLWELLQDAQVQRAAVPVAGHRQNGGIVGALLVEQGLDGLRAVVVFEQHDPFGSALDVLLGGDFQLGDGVEDRLTGLDRELALGRVGQRVQFRQRRAAGLFKQAHREAGAFQLSQQADEVLHVSAGRWRLGRLA